MSRHSAGNGPSALPVSSLAAQTCGLPPLTRLLSGVDRPKVNSCLPVGSWLCALIRESWVAPSPIAPMEPAGLDGGLLDEPVLPPHAAASAESPRAPAAPAARRRRSRRERSPALASGSAPGGNSARMGILADIGRSSRGSAARCNLLLGM